MGLTSKSKQVIRDTYAPKVCPPDSSAFQLPKKSEHMGKKRKTMGKKKYYYYYYYPR